MKLDWVWNWFTVDTRALAAMRIALALVMLFDVYSHQTELLDYYTDSGFTPRSVVPESRYASLYFLSGSAGYVQCLFALHALMAILLLVGYQTRLATIGCLIMVQSMIARNQILTNSGDSFLFWLLTWSIFLPLGARASVDSRTSRTRAPPTVCNLATVALLLQVVFVYWGAGLGKNTPLWISDFSAVYVILSSHLGTPLGLMLARYPVATKLVTLATLVLEILGPVAALVTIRQPRLRALMVLAFFCFHIGIATTVYVSAFSFISMAAWLPYVPAPAWDVLEKIFPWDIIRRGWGGMMDALAKMVEGLSRAIKYAAARSISGVTLGAPGRAIVAVLLAYVVFLNLLTDAMLILRRPLPSLPAAKQVWNVMATVPTGAQWFVIQATFADGSVVTIDQSAQLQNERKVGWMRFLIPPDNGRLPIFHQRLQAHTVAGKLQYIDAYCKHQLALARARFPDKKIVSISAYSFYQEIPPVDSVNVTPEHILHPLYTLNVDGSRTS
ncbi:MAG TPA: HTTM domain-containing protein [Tepidisphaeraceae bacterium]